jgi:Sodium/hydrogen exchanger family
MSRRDSLSSWSSSSVRSTTIHQSSKMFWMRTILLLYGCDWMLASASAQETSTQEEDGPVVNVLFPWFSLLIGTLAYFALSRLLPWLPYTAVMFIIGTMIGAAVVRLDRDTLLTKSVTSWLNIDSEVLLLVFLPGLVAKDAMQLNATLFRAAFWQCIVFAFPMVLAGTSLTAVIVYFVFPYGWSFNFAMTLGSVRQSYTSSHASVHILSYFFLVHRLSLHGAADIVRDRSSGRSGTFPQMDEPFRPSLSDTSHALLHRHRPSCPSWALRHDYRFTFLEKGTYLLLSKRSTWMILFCQFDSPFPSPLYITLSLLNDGR